MSEQTLDISGANAAPAVTPRAVARPRLSQWAIVGIVTVVALLNGFLYLLTVPPWQHYDEPTHFEYVWLYAQLERRPVQTDIDRAMRRELAATMLSEGFYDDLTLPDLLDEGGVGPWIGIIELPHPPLYYYLTSLPLRLIKNVDLTTQLYVARGVSLLMFMLIVLITAALMTELTPRGHPLRWGVPLAVALLPSFANQMTAVNNDVGAVLMATLYLWASVRLVRRLTLWRVLLVIAISGLGILTKSTAALSVATLPLVFVLALWRAAGWSWRWFWVGGLLVLILPTLLLFSFDDAAYWFRGWGTFQEAPMRGTPPAAPWGEAALTLTLEAGEPVTLLNPLTRAQALPLAGEMVTLGGWLWADAPITSNEPVLFFSTESLTGLERRSTRIPLTTEPTFHGRVEQVPQGVGRVHYGIVTHPPQESDPTTVYLDGAFLVEGTLSLDTPPRLEGDQVIAADGTRHANLLRNPSAEQPGPRVRPWIDHLLTRYNRTVTNHIVMSLFDLQRTLPLIFSLVLPHLVINYVIAFGWGHVLLPGWVGVAGLAVAVVALLGALRWVIAHRRALPNGPALLVVAALLGVSVGSALLWPLPFNIYDQQQLPAGRYLFPATFAILLVLVGGWGALFPRRWRVEALLVLLGGVLLLNGFALYTIQTYYR